MATLILTDPTDLISGGDTGTTPLAPLVVDETTKTITITPGSGILPASSDGITGQALYSALKILWRNSSTYIKYPFPMEAITPEQFDFINGWTLANDVTRKALRTCGWTEYDTNGQNVIRRYMGVVTLGTLAETDTSYFQWNTDVKDDFTFPGPINEGIQIFGDVSNGNVNYFQQSTGADLTLFNRIQGKTYSSATNASIGANLLSYIVYRFPLSNATDLNITASDAHIEYSDTITGATWTGGVAEFTVTSSADLEIGSRVYISGMTPSTYDGTYAVTAKSDGTHFSVAITNDPGAFVSGTAVTSVHANITIDFTTAITGIDVNEDTTDESYTVDVNDSAGTATTNEIYEKVQYLLRQPSPTDIDTGAGTVIGDTQAQLLGFVGSTLVGEPGTYISNLNSAFLNSVTFYESTDTAKSTPIIYPFIASGVINFGANAGSGVYKYWMFYNSGSLDLGTAADEYGGANATIVKDRDGVDIAGTYSGSSVPFTFKYTQETAGGLRTADQDADVIVVGIGLESGQFASVTSTITKATGQSILLAPAQERNYDNPA